VSVAVPIPALGLLTYKVPPGRAVPARGVRVVVPLGSRSLTGLVVGEAAGPEVGIELRELAEVLDEQPFLPHDVMELADWVADYYLAGPGAALSIAMPPHALSSRVDAFRTVRTVALTAQGHDAAIQPPGSLTARQREALAVLRGVPNGLVASELATRGVTAPIVSRLRAMGLVTVRRERVERDPFTSPGAVLTASETLSRPLTVEQQTAVDRLRTLAGLSAFHVALLHGVTGSGKTEVYLHLAEAVRQLGRSALILVPEIALTPAIAAAFRARFSAAVAIQHSGLSNGERHDQWHRIRRGEVDVVVGTRSAVFAPLAHLGLIVVDEEHDTSYKQEETPRYHGRDVAVMRGKLTGALVVLGSATPSMESYYNARQRRYEVLALSRRVLDRPLANVLVVNMRDEIAVEGPEVILSRTLRERMGHRLERGEQALVLLNRRGYATSVFCRQCGDTMDCPNCSVSLTVHTLPSARRPQASERFAVPWRARCHYCDFSRLVPKACVKCAAPYLEHIGFGTERLEAEIRELFPEARVGRVDRDTIGRRGSLTSILDRFAKRQLDVLVGTQMIAKGHDFPRVTLVGVISADVGLGVADFRAAERTFQLLTQVAGRAGRGDQAGEAVIQTLFPSHYSVRLATSQDYVAFFEKEVDFRRKMRYPPTVAMVNVIVRGKTFAAAMQGATDLSRRTSERDPGGFAILGPAPAPLTRLRGEHRAQFFLKGHSRKAMRNALSGALASLPQLARRVSVDVDPMNVL
jgi:primosomal protein N' (replication factor Y)